MQQNFGSMHLVVMKLWMPTETLMTRFEELDIQFPPSMSEEEVVA